MWEKTEDKTAWDGEMGENAHSMASISSHARKLEDELVERWGNGETLTQPEMKIVIGCINAGMRRRLAAQIVDAFTATK